MVQYFSSALPGCDSHIVLILIYLPACCSINREHRNFLLGSKFKCQATQRLQLFFYFFIISSLRSAVTCLIFCSDTKGVPQESKQTGAKHLHIKQPQEGFVFSFFCLRTSTFFFIFSLILEAGGGGFHSNIFCSRLTYHSFS